MPDAVKLSSLRVTAEMDSGPYVAGMNQKVGADKAGTTSSEALGAAMAKQDMAADLAGGAVSRLSRSYIDGYGTSAKFYSNVASLQRQMELGNVTAERATLIYQGLVAKFGMVASAADTAKAGNAALADVISRVNARTDMAALASQKLSGHASHLEGTFIGTSNAAKLSNFQLQNMSFQMQDLGQAILTGQPLFRTFIQQGSQLAQIFGPGVGVAGALKAVGAGVVTFITNPLNLAVLAIAGAAAAAGLLFSAITGRGGESAADALKRHKEIIDEITKAYSEANIEARKLGQIETTPLKAQGMAEMVQLTNKIAEERKRFADEFGKLFQIGNSQALLGGLSMGNPFANMHVPQGFLDEVEKYKQSIRDGSADTGAFRETLSKLALAFPTSENQKFVDSVLKATQGTIDLEKQQKLLAATLRAAAGQATVEDSVLLNLVGKLNSAAIATANLRQKLAGNEMTMARPNPRDTSLSGFSSRFDPIVAARHEAEEAAKKSAGIGESLQKQFDTALKTAEKATDALVAQGGAFGQTAGQIAEFTKQQELLNLAEANHLTLSPQEIAHVNEIAAAYGKATTELERMKDAQAAQTFLAKSLFDSVRGAHSLAEAFSNLADKIANAALEAALLGSGPLAGLFGTTKSQSGGIFGSLFSGLFGGGGAGHGVGQVAMGGLYHSGGTVGSSAVPGRYVHPEYFDRAPRLHSGLGGDEFPAILQRGEKVIPRGNAAQSGTVVQIIDQRTNGGAIKQERSTGPDGRTMIRAIIQDELGSGRADKALQSRYGMRPSKAR